MKHLIRVKEYVSKLLLRGESSRCGTGTEISPKTIADGFCIQIKRNGGVANESYITPSELDVEQHMKN